MKSFIKIGVLVLEKSADKIMTLCNFNKDTHLDPKYVKVTFFRRIHYFSMLLSMYLWRSSTTKSIIEHKLVKMPLRYLVRTPSPQIQCWVMIHQTAAYFIQICHTGNVVLPKKIEHFCKCFMKLTAVLRIFLKFKLWFHKNVRINSYDS